MGWSIAQTTDGGYVIAGITASFGAGSWDFYIVKLDAQGNLQWTKTIGGTNDDRAYSIIQTNDGGYAIAGYTWSFSADFADVYLVKLNAAGNLQWTKTIGGINADRAWSVTQTADGGYAIAGVTGSFGAGNWDYYVVKLDATGNLQWTKTIGGTSNDHGRSIIQTNDGGYAIAGYTLSFGAGNYDVYIVKLDAQGNLQWTKTVGGADNDYGISIIQTADGGYAIAGYTYSFGAGAADVYVIKLNAQGNLQWAKTIGGVGNDVGYSIIQTADGGYAIAGQTFSFGTGSWDVYVVKLNAQGNLQWTRTIGGTNDDIGYSIIQTTDGGYAITGYTTSFGTGSNDVYVIKLDAAGNLVNCPNGCQTSSGGTTGSGGVVGSGGSTGSGGTTGSGGSTSSGGTLTNICP